MKKTILLIAVIFIIITIGNCQNNAGELMSNYDKQSSTSIDLIKYYFTIMQTDSSVFSSDTLKLVKTEINKEFPRFEFNNDFRYCFFYDIKLEMHTMRDVDNGEIAERVVEKSKKIQGAWKTNDIQKDISLTLIDKLTVNYSIIEGDKVIYFIRVK
ncbi:MAG: hypothetical protein Q8R96_18995 [Bacteroidota bacterium]|nr:hypothetical protein [Bacteroidota bacterium]